MPTSESTNEPGAQARGPSLAVSVFSGAGIGLMVGAMLGLAVPSGDGKSIVGYFIAAVGAGLAALLGLNDAHFSSAKGLRIGAFGLGVLVAAPLGVIVKEHHLLEPSLASTANRLRDAGLDEEKVTAIVTEVAKKPGAGLVAGATSNVNRCKDFKVEKDVASTLKFYRSQGRLWRDAAEKIDRIQGEEDQRAALEAVSVAICNLHSEMGLGERAE